jgi:type II secretory pathway pseudopilin PulG
LGCTNQGRNPEAAEACTEFGTDDFDDSIAIGFILKRIVIAVVIVGIIAAVAVLL